MKRVDDDGRLPIHWAVAHNHPEIVHLLMDQPGFDVDIQDELGWTPLMIACSRKDGDELVELFLERGADVNMTGMRLSQYLVVTCLISIVHFLTLNDKLHAQTT